MIWIVLKCSVRFVSNFGHSPFSESNWDNLNEQIKLFFLVFADLYINFTKSLDNQIKSNTIHYKNTHTYSISRCTYVNRWSVYLSIDWSIYLSTNLSVYLSIYLIDLIYLISLMYLICLICLINLSNLSNHSNQANLLNLSDLSKVYLIYLVLSIHRSVCLSVCPSVHLSIYVCVNLYVSIRLNIKCTQIIQHTVSLYASFVYIKYTYMISTNIHEYTWYIGIYIYI